MIDWLQNPQADYVVAAYGLVFVALAVLTLLSWRWARTQDRLWQKLRRDRQGDSRDP